MVATIGLPGAQGFRYFIGTKKECHAWLEKVKEDIEEARAAGYADLSLENAYRQSDVVSNKKASRWTYRDGSKVIHQFDRAYQIR